MAEKGKSGSYQPLRSLTRLLVGGILLGSDLLDNQLRNWDGGIEDNDPKGVAAELQTLQPDDPFPDTLPAPKVGAPPQKNSVDMRYALVGLIFESQDKIEGALTAAERVSGVVDRMLYPVLQPIKKIGTVGPVRKTMDQLTRRGQSQVDRWISRGIEEEAHSRQLTQEAATSTVDQSILYMAENEAITELIQVQSISLAEQILQLIRTMSISADIFFEGLVRYTLRRTPRYLLPAPEQHIQEQATWSLQDFRQEDDNGDS